MAMKYFSFDNKKNKFLGKITIIWMTILWLN